VRPSDHQTAEEFLAELAAGFEQLGPGAVRVEHVTDLSPAGGLWAVVFVGVDPDGGAYELPMPMVLRVAGGSIVGFDGYDEGDGATARAALAARDGTALRSSDEPAIQRPAPGENLATRALQRAVAALNGRDWQGFVDVHAPSFVFIDNRRGVRLREEGEERFTTYALFLTFEDFTLERMPVATRGERLVLSRNVVRWKVGAAGPSEVETVAVVECDADGLIVSDTGFDPDEIDTAYALLDARHAEQEAAAAGNLAWRAVQRECDAINRRDWQGLLDMLDPGFVQVDHRHAAGLRLEGDDAIATFRVLFSLDEFTLARELLAARGDLLALTRGRVRFVDGQAGQSEVEHLTLFECSADGLIVSDTGFEPYDLRRAYAALEARHAEIAEFVPSPNRAARVVAAHDGAFARRDWEALIGCYAPGFVLEDRRSYVARVYTEEESLGTVRHAYDNGEIQWARRVLATRGERLALVRDDVSGLDGEVEFELQSLTLVEIDRDGLVSHHTAFDPEDLELAVAELDARAAVLDAEQSS
jgi:hypothetical protein